MTGQVLPFEQPDPLGRARPRRARALGKAQGILQRGEHLFHAGEDIEFPYLVVAGVLKSYVSDENGEECVIGFHMPGDVVGFEAVIGRKTFCGAIALDTTKVLPLRHPGSQEPNTANSPDLMTEMYREILRLIHLLQMDRGSTEGRVARFLGDYSELQAQRGCSRRSLVLPMARYDLARYLGLATETVSRVLSRFRDRGWLTVDNNHITILDATSLLRTARGSANDYSAEPQ
ncbi:MAG: helix-turn-helix domain-containing protein [Ectothiorhodospiraceae bacterium]|nr:helix-turn-helix domain-containing protein [Ectothiorhodospiraceae bacterium]MCH8506348.1 helix-turn-helix domain-containing protein [Ectothiorhodospiraceae bacterium]